MARRATAVSLACLLAAGQLPLPERAPARPTAGCAAPGPARLANPPARAEPAAFALRDPLAGSRAPGAPRTPEPRAPRPRDVAEVLGELARRLGKTAVPTRITVPTWVHVLSDGVVRASDASVRAQIDTLNRAYAGHFGGVGTGVHFRLDGTTVTRSATWFVDPLGNEQAMKTALRKGGPETLNLYVGQLGDLVLGYSAYPYWYQDGPSLDGVVIDWRTLPGGSMANYDRGFTGVHEIGHWLGLFHTFENGCADPGDGIADTPAEAKPSEGCSDAADTCPLPGNDPNRNFMDYAQDRCMQEFTAGQAERMHQMWAVYRKDGGMKSASVR
jgi:hypothetical protein